MALTEDSVVDSIEVLLDGQIQVRKANRVFRDGVEISKSYHRHVVSPGDNLSLEDKIKKIASEIYGANELEISTTAKKQLKELQGTNYEKFPVCIAKTQYSFTADPENGGLPQEHNLPIKEIRVSAGAEFVVVICGDIMLMPGLPKTPAAESIYIDEKGLIQGLF